MIICKTIQALTIQLTKLKSANKQIGFVPTMGALHNGHISLINLSLQQAHATICSIFVNPTQFNDPKDFEKYPITIEKDVLMLEQAGCNILFLPSVQEMYPNGFTTTKQYNLGFLETVLDGSYRPGHFKGVCQVVERLLEIVMPTKLFLGQKDYQQCMVINKLLQINNWQQKIQLVIGNTLREETGLAMSSRNMRLSHADKQNATAIYNSLQYIKQNIATQPILTLQQNVTETLLKNGFTSIDYIAICHAQTLQPINNWDETIKTVALIAAFINGVRLIDNLLIN